MKYCLPLLVLLALIAAGCTASPEPSYGIDEAGLLEVHVPVPVVVEEDTIWTGDGVTLNRTVFRAGQGEVACLIAMPANPEGAIILVPGAGVLKEAHYNRSIGYARAGLACLVPDVRGMGGETPGEPVSIDREIATLQEGGVPQYFRVVGDLCAARKLLAERTGIPVFVAGSSQGGRYAALAAAADPEFAGYAGISTGGFDSTGERYTGAAREFLLAVDP
ncbi:MAG: alpha/beta hydrolase, partial [Methanoculleaceae archaeon]